MAKTFNDPLFASQWYLLNTGQRGGTSRLDINVMSAWDRYSGKGVIVAVNDDGMDLTHPSLVANLLTNLTYDTARGTTGKGFEGTDNSHGTVVGSIVGMAGNDGIGGVGVAYGAKIVAGVAIGKGLNYANVALANLAAGASVSVNSWGADPAFSENFGSGGGETDQEWGAALMRAATEARGGLGMVVEVSAGNERANLADSAMSGWSSSKLIIAVGAVTEMGVHTDYSTPGASLLITAPGGVSSGDQSLNSGFGIVSADIQGANGYNTLSGKDGDYAYQNIGTSYSGPMVGGAAALMLEANPNLGFRDVSTILAMTAKKVDATNTSWLGNKSSNWNLGGMHFSRDYGYGLLDVSAAVRLAESWPLASGTIANWSSAQGTATITSGIIPDNSATGKTVTATVSNAVSIERMEFDLNLTATNPSQLSATITSPSGTTVTLFDRPLTRDLKDGAPDMSTTETAWPSTFTIGSTAFLGESSVGTWTLKLTDKVTGVEATYNSLTVRAWGSAITDNSHYVFTNEFGGTGLVLTDTGGVDTLNASALETAVILDLGAGQKSTVGNGIFNLAQSSVLENAIGGLGNDTLLGNLANNVLRGNRGDDVLDGNTGIDTAVFSGSRAGYELTIGTKIQVVDKSGLEGTDNLTKIERLQFTDKSVAIDLDGNAGSTAKIIGAVLGNSALKNPTYVGIGLSYLDKGMSYSDLGALALTAVGAATNDAIVSTLWLNVIGSPASAMDKAPFVKMLADGMKAGDLVALAADTAFNTSNINLVGLAQTGIEYIPVS
jgi:subtilisin-like proprotein convertase family protein